MTYAFQKSGQMYFKVRDLQDDLEAAKLRKWSFRVTVACRRVAELKSVESKCLIGSFYQNAHFTTNQNPHSFNCEEEKSQNRSVIS